MTVAKCIEAPSDALRNYCEYAGTVFDHAARTGQRIPDSHSSRMQYLWSSLTEAERDWVRNAPHCPHPCSPGDAAR